MAKVLSSNAGTRKAVQKSPEEKDFLFKTKLLFSTLTARSCPYVYFNVHQGGVILSNSTSPPPNDEHGDRLMDYKVGELGLHFVNIKDTAYLQKLRAFLQVPDQGCYVVLGTRVVSMLNKYRPKDLRIITDDAGRNYLVPKTTTKPVKELWIGNVIHTFHVTLALTKWNNYAAQIGQSSLEQQFPHATVPITPEMVTERTFFITADLSSLSLRGKPAVLSDTMTQIKLLGVDGISTISVVEYINKVAKSEAGGYTHMLYMWMVNQAYLLSATLFEDGYFRVISMRPNTMGVLMD